MIEFLFGMMIYATWYAFIVGPFILFILRLYYGLHHHLPNNRLVKLVLTPLSIGFFMEVKTSIPFRKWYQWMSIFNFVAMIIGSVFIFYMVIE